MLLERVTQVVGRIADIHPSIDPVDIELRFRIHRQLDADAFFDGTGIVANVKQMHAAKNDEKRPADDVRAASHGVAPAQRMARDRPGQSDLPRIAQPLHDRPERLPIHIDAHRRQRVEQIVRRAFERRPALPKEISINGFGRGVLIMQRDQRSADLPVGFHLSEHGMQPGLRLGVSRVRQHGRDDVGIADAASRQRLLHRLPLPPCPGLELVEHQQIASRQRRLRRRVGGRRRRANADQQPERHRERPERAEEAKLPARS